MEDYSKYAKEQLVTLLEYIDRPVETFSEACVRYYPVIIVLSLSIIVITEPKRINAFFMNRATHNYTIGCLKKLRR